MPDQYIFDPGTANALLFRADGTVRVVNPAGAPGPAALVQAGTNWQFTIRDPRTDLTRTGTIDINGRVTVQQ